MVHDAERLKELQALDLNHKIMITQTRIIEWYEKFNGNVYISFSGGKDSTVLLHIARKLFPDIPAVFSNTGLEYYQIQRFAKQHDNVTFITPKIRFDQVVSTFGYPLISKEVSNAIAYARKISTCSRTAQFRRNRLLGIGNRCDKDGEQSIYNMTKYVALAQETPFLISHMCCHKMKKAPLKAYQRQTKSFPILATMAEESRIRKQAWIRHGCNAFESNHPMSQPLSFWTEQDVLAYIVKYNVPLCPVYGDIVSVDADGNEYPPKDLFGSVQCNLSCTGCKRTGCVFCGFGFHNEKGKTRFQLLAEIEPRKYEYALQGGQFVDNPHYDSTAPKMDGEWLNWNPKKIWVPSKHGLGMKFVFDSVNEIYGKEFYRYE